MAYSTFEPGDNLPALEAKLDADAALHEALQGATGIAEGATNIGTASDLAGSFDAGDSLVARARKTGARLTAVEAAVGATAPDEDLGIDFDLATIDATIRGTTSVENEPVLSTYPDGAGLYLIETVASVAVDGTSFGTGDAIAIAVSKRDSAGVLQRWIGATIDGGETVVWKEVGGPVTTSQIVDRNVTRIKCAEDVFYPITRTLALPTDPLVAGQMTGGDFAVMPIQQDDRFIMTETPFEYFQRVATFVAGAREYYVDGLLGDDTGPGTAADPYKTMEQAMSRTDLGTCWVAPGVYQYLDMWSGGSNPSISDVVIANTAAYAVRRWDNGQQGDVIMSTHHEAGTYALVGGTTDTYEIAHTDCVNVVDHRHRTSNGAYVAYKELDGADDAAKAAAVDEAEGTWARGAGNYIYVHRIGGGKPGKNSLLLCFDIDNIDETSNRTVYSEGLTFVGGNDAMTMQSATTGIIGGTALFEDCDFFSSVQSGLKVTQLALVYAANCRAIGNGFDGFQGFGINNDPSDDVGGDFITYNCVSDDNGHNTPLDSSNNINGFSNHYGMRTLHVQASASGNKGPQFADIYHCQTWWVGCKAGFSRSITGSVTQASLSVLTDSKGWAYRCEAPYLFSSSGSYAGHDQSLLGGQTGTAVPYTQA